MGLMIGIAKLNTDVRDVNVCVDTNGRYKELLDLFDIFNNNGHDAFIIDKDLLKYKKKELKEDLNFDIIFLLNGIIDDGTIKEIKTYKSSCKKLVYILTDLRLINSSMSVYFNSVLTQSISEIPFIKAPQSYNGMPELACYNERYDFSRMKKNRLLIFGGGIRNREEDFEKYFLRPEILECDLYAKHIGIDTRVPIDEYHDALLNSKYSIVINDPEYNEHGFITWRYFENISKGVITFLDSKVDKDKIIGIDGFVRKFLTVDDVLELRERILFLENNKQLRKYILDEQNKLVDEEKISGKYTYNMLLRGVK